jgi:transcriptional regulator with XRE-family HTH domain
MPGPPDPVPFGNQLRKLREKANLTRGELAARAGTDRTTLHRYETGERQPAWPAVVALAKALGVTPNAFRP